jgi:hypothetical protein
VNLQDWQPMQTFTYARGQQTLCTVCQRRAQSNGQRFIRLTIDGNDMHEAKPDVGMVIDGNDPWAAEKLRLMEAERGKREG